MAAAPNWQPFPVRAGFSGRAQSRRDSSRPEADFTNLLDRMCQHRYPASLPVLAFYWLRTVLGSGYEPREWAALRRLVAEIPPLDDCWRQTASQLQGWMEQATARVHEQEQEERRRLERVPAQLDRSILAPYIYRLLNEWLPAEVAHLLADEPEVGLQSPGIPLFAIARAVERLLVREHLSASTLEALLEPGLLSPRFVYPSDAEILGNVVLFLLGRTGAPAKPVLPAVVLHVAADSPLASGHGEAAALAFVAGGQVYIPIAPEQAAGLLRRDRLRIGSIVVTMDGRWWQADRLVEDRDQHLIAYRPAGHLEIDYSADHARLRVPWPEARSQWNGPVEFPEPIEIFGRQWKVERWDQDGARTWLHLVFVRSMPVSQIAPVAATSLRRSRPASVDIAWAALENALAAAARARSAEPIEALRHAELIPVGRAIYALLESLSSHSLRKRDMLETRLRSIAYLESELAPSYGRIPWRIFPERAREKLLCSLNDHGLRHLLETAFEGFGIAGTHSPPHAA